MIQRVLGAYKLCKPFNARKEALKLVSVLYLFLYHDSFKQWNKFL